MKILRLLKITVVFLLIAGIVGGSFMLLCKDNKKTNAKENSTNVVEQTETKTEDETKQDLDVVSYHNYFDADGKKISTSVLKKDMKESDLFVPILPEKDGYTMNFKVESSIMDEKGIIQYNYKAVYSPIKYSIEYVFCYPGSSFESRIVDYSEFQHMNFMPSNPATFILKEFYTVEDEFTMDFSDCCFDSTIPDFYEFDFCEIESVSDTLIRSGSLIYTINKGTTGNIRLNIYFYSY